MLIYVNVFFPVYVTLHVSVWVEMTTWKSWQIFSVSHAPRERVSWNAWYVMQIRELQVSRSTWACELKLKNSATQAEPIVSRSTWACELKYVKLWLVSRGFSHAPRERVSWNSPRHSARVTGSCHAPRERVSWNRLFPFNVALKNVTLHVSVWVEILFNIWNFT